MTKSKILQIQNNDYDSTTSVGKAIALYSGDCYDITTVFLTGKKNTSINQDKKIYLNLPQYALKGIGRWWAIIKLLKMLNSSEYDLIIAHRFKPLHIALILSKILKIPTIGVIHAIGEYKRPYRQNIIRKLSSPRTKFVAVSSYVLKYLISLESSFNYNNTRVITNSVDFTSLNNQMLSQLEARKKLNLEDNLVYFGTIGRLVSVKGHEQILQAATILKQENLTFRVAIIGDGPNRESLTSQVKSLGLENHVILLGKVEQGFRYLKAFDIFMMTSYSEGFPLALLEAMAAKLPIIGSSIPAITDILNHEHGELFPINDINALATQMKKLLLTSHEVRISAGESIHRYAQANFNINQFRIQYNLVIAESLESSRSATE